MWQLKWVSTVSMLLIMMLAKIHARPHLNQLETLPVPYGLPGHFDYAPAPAVEALTWLPLPAPGPLVSVPATAQVPTWPTETLPAVAPAPLLPAPFPARLPAPLPAPVPLVPVPATAQVPTWPTETLPAVAPAPLLPAPLPSIPAIHQHLLSLPPAEFHLPTITQVLPPILEAAPFTPSYRAIPGPKTTTTKVGIGYAFPKLLATSHASLRASPLNLARYHHHHLHF